MGRHLKHWLAAAAIAGTLVWPSWALPTGGEVKAGQATVSSSNGRMTIVQSGQRTIISWDGFSIGSAESVQFIQPSALSAILNRVTGADPSVILGTLQANGQVFLVNPNGVFFGAGSVVDVGSLVVSTLGLSDQDFLTGNYQFAQRSVDELAAIVNQGSLKIADNGFLVLAAPHVSNEGLIIANQGKVALLGGEKAAVSFDGAGLINFEVAELANDKSTVLMPTETVSEVLAGVVSNPGIAEGTELAVVDGELQLINGSGTVVNSGEINAVGGTLVLDSTGATVLTSEARLEAGHTEVLSQGQAVALPGSTVDLGEDGFAELSGQQIVAGLTAQGSGQFLIDPPILTIENGPMPGMPAPDTVYEEALEASVVDILLVADDGVMVNDIADNRVTIPAEINFEVSISTMVGPGLTFADPDDGFETFGMGSIAIFSGSGIGPGQFESESVVALLAADGIGTGTQPVEVLAPILSISAGADAFLQTNVDALFASVAGDLDVQETDSVEISGLSVTGSANLVAGSDITADPMSDPDLMTGGNATLNSQTGTLGSVAEPIDISVGGNLFTSAGDEVGGASVTLTGSVVGSAEVSASTPGTAELNGLPLDVTTSPPPGGGGGGTGPDDLVDLEGEFGLGTGQTEMLFGELGMLAQTGPGGPGGPGTGPGGPEGGPGGPEGGPNGRGPNRQGGPGGPPMIAQAGLLPQLQMSTLLNMNVGQFPEISVELGQPSPFDAILDSSRMQADDLLDLDPDEIKELGLSSTYDISQDPIFRNPNLTAGDLFDLGAAELGEIPISLH